MSSRSRNGSSSGSSGTTAAPPWGSEATTSALASATFSTVPRSSRCTGPMLVITPMSGLAIAHSSAIWPIPRMPISQTTTSVSGSIRVSVSGRPISLLCPPSAATVFACGRHIAARMSFVDVLPVEPVMPTTRAELRPRTALPRAAIPANASSGTSVAAAPRANACRVKSSPPSTAKKRSPSSMRRESTCTPVTSSAQGAASSRPGQSAATSSRLSGITSSPPRVSSGLPVRLLGHRRELFGRGTAAPARGLCPR